MFVEDVGGVSKSVDVVAVGWGGGLWGVTAEHLCGVYGGDCGYGGYSTREHVGAFVGELAKSLHLLSGIFVGGLRASFWGGGGWLWGCPQTCAPFSVSRCVCGDAVHEGKRPQKLPTEAQTIAWP